jgi:hypothetical protein
VLNLPTLRDVDALIKTRILIPAAYDPNGRPLFDAGAVRRAAAHIIRPEPSPA